MSNDTRAAHDQLLSHTYTPNGALMVEGLEDWILTLLPLQNAEGPFAAIRMVDSKTGAVFLIARVE